MPSRAPCSGSHRLEHVLVMLVLAGVTVMGGCRRRTDAGLVPVSGRVLLPQSLKGRRGSLVLYPADDDPSQSGTARRPGFAEFDVEGEFVAQTRVPGDGMLPGRYRVGVSVRTEEDPSTPPTGVKVAAPAWGDPFTSPLLMEVPEGGTTTAVVTLPE